MEFFEAEILLKTYNKNYREEKEWQRFLKFLDAKMQGAKVSQPESLFKLPWEKIEKKPRPSNKEIAEAVERMSLSLKALKQKEQVLPTNNRL